MIVKYLTNKYLGCLIEKVEVDKETEASIWINGNRHLKISSWDRYYDTWEEAHEYISIKNSTEIRNAERKLQNLLEVQKDIENLRETI